MEVRKMVPYLSKATYVVDEEEIEEDADVSNTGGHPNHDPHSQVDSDVEVLPGSETVADVGEDDADEHTAIVDREGVEGFGGRKRWHHWKNVNFYIMNIN